MALNTSSSAGPTSPNCSPSQPRNFPIGSRNATTMATTAATANTVQPTGPENTASKPGISVLVAKVSKPPRATVIAAMAGPTTPPKEAMAPIAGASTTKAAARATTPPINVCNGPGRLWKPSAMAEMPSVKAVNTGSKAVPMPTPSSRILACNAAILSLNLSAPLANDVDIVAVMLSIESRPPLSIGIMSAPALPNNAMAAVVLLAPSGIF